MLSPSNPEVLAVRCILTHSHTHTHTHSHTCTHIQTHTCADLPQAMVTDSEGEPDFVIVEDSSSDSEDEEEGDEVRGHHY